MMDFINRLNIKTGEQEWVLLPDDYDYFQEIGRAAYTDMLHDFDRNEKYYTALKRTISYIKSKGMQAVVLDIGTGTGLLSMMALRAGADCVYACEAFEPMSRIAVKVTLSNCPGDKLKIINKRSTDLLIPADIPTRCNILVTEVFDTELIGEGAINTYNHAIKELLTVDFVSVPSLGTVYIQFATSELIKKCNTLPEEMTINNLTIKLPKTQHCSGVNSVQDLQLSSLKEGQDFTSLSQPIPAFVFDWTKPTLFPRSTLISIPTDDFNTVFLYWKLQMTNKEVYDDGCHDNVISCFPQWIEDNYFWRDHWIQCAYYVPHSNSISCLKITHDEWSYNFNDKSGCVCSIHKYVSRSRLLQLNENELLYSYLLKAVVKCKKSNVLIISDNTLLHLFLEKTKLFKNIYIHGDVFGDKRNDTVDDLLDLVVVGDPYFISSVTPLDNLKFFWKAKEFKDVFPRKAVVRGIFVEFEHLFKIRKPITTTCGFDLTEFDKVVFPAMSYVDNRIESHPVTEYEYKKCSQLFDILQINSCDELNTIVTGSVKLNCSNINGIIFYVDYIINDDEIVTTRFTKQPQAVQFINYNDDIINYKFDLENGLTI